MRKAIRLEVLTMAYVVSAAGFLYVTMGSSQAMRTSFFEEALSIVPSLAFLVAARLASRAADQDHPYGFHGVVSIGYLTASLALVAMGTFLLLEAGLKLAAVERTTIGGTEVLGRVVWAGWPMLAALAYSGIPAVVLGRLKLELAPAINDRILHAGAKMMRADWMTESATAVGVLGVGFGLWWVDPLAAAVVSLGILKDGLVNLRIAIDALIERTPMTIDRSEADPLPQRLARHLGELDWVSSVELRLREVGHVYFGEAYVVPRDVAVDLPRRIGEAMESAKALDWRLHELTITPVPPAPEKTADPSLRSAGAGADR